MQAGELSISISCTMETKSGESLLNDELLPFSGLSTGVPEVSYAIAQTVRTRVQFRDYRAPILGRFLPNSVAHSTVGGWPLRRSNGKLPLFFYPDETRILTGTGDVFAITTGDRLLELEDAVIHAAFQIRHGAVTYNGGVLTGWDGLGQPTGSALPATIPSCIADTGSDVLIFTPKPNGGAVLEVSVVPGSDLGLSAAKPSFKLTEVPFQIDESAFAVSGNRIACLSKEFSAVLYWSVADNAFTEATPLGGMPEVAVLDDMSGSIYIGKADGSISTLDSAETQQSETQFALVEGMVRGIAFRNGFVFIAHGTPGEPGKGLTRLYSVFSVDGVKVEEGEAPNPGNRFWIAIEDALYYSISEGNYNRITVNADNSLGESLDGRMTENDVYIRPGKTGIIATNTGNLIDVSGIDLNRIGRTPSPTADAAWIGDGLVTATVATGTSELSLWDSKLTVPKATIPLSGEVSRVVVTTPENRIVAISNGVKRPRFHVLDESLTLKSSSVGEPPNSARRPSVVSLAANSVTLVWSPVPGATSYRVEYVSMLDASGWVSGDSIDASTSRATVSGLEPDSAYRFRVVAANSGGEAAPGSESWYTTIGTEVPEGRPYNLELVSGSATTLTVRWAHGGHNTTNYEILVDSSNRGSVGEESPVVASLPANTDTYTIRNLAPDTRHGVAVRAENAFRKAELSRSVSSRTAQSDEAPPSGYAWIDLELVEEGRTHIVEGPSPERRWNHHRTAGGLRSRSPNCRNWTSRPRRWKHS